MCEVAYREFMSSGTALFSVYSMSALGAEEGVEHREVEHIIDTLIDEGVIETAGGRTLKAGPEMALHYELEIDLRAHVKANVLRRELLRAGVDAYLDSTEVTTITQDERGPFEQYEWGELYAATEVLEVLGLLARGRAMGSLRPLATPAGYDLMPNQAELAATLPVSLAEVEGAHALVAPDALADLIRDCEQMLTERGWTGALRELARGDDEVDKRDWVDAVSEYYAALESGLKHRLDELRREYAPKAGLHDLARAAADADAIPPNYQALFGFVDSIRSPRRHGAGGKIEEVEVGPAEALLMGNHVRTLLLYLGHRPR